MLPATRTTKRSPTPWSKISSGATRESAHATMAASGACPSASAAKSSGFRPGGRAAPYEPLVALEQPGEHGVGPAGRGRLAAAVRSRAEPSPAAPAASPVSRTNSRRDERCGDRMTNPSKSVVRFRNRLRSAMSDHTRPRQYRATYVANDLARECIKASLDDRQLADRCFKLAKPKLGDLSHGHVVAGRLGDPSQK